MPNLRPSVTKSYVIEEFVMQVDDHIPAATDIHLQPDESPDIISTRRVTKIDKEKIKDPIRKAAFISDFICIQQQYVPWNIDVNEHCATRQSQVKQCAEKHFPSDKHKKQRAYIQEDTWQLILAQKACKRTIKYISRIRQLWQNADIFIA